MSNSWTDRNYENAQINKSRELEKNFKNSEPILKVNKKPKTKINLEFRKKNFNQIYRDRIGLF